MKHFTIACVYRTGGEYDTRYVERLYAAVARVAHGIPYRFVCLTDAALATPGVETIPLQYNWPRWWPKMELWRPGLFPEGTPVLYLDIDTVLVRRWDGAFPWRGLLAQAPVFLEDFAPSKAGGFASGVVAWRAGEMRAVWEAFMVDPVAAMNSNRPRMDRFTAQHLPKGTLHWQALCPGELVSYKLGVVKNGLGPATRVVCFHGPPRLHRLPMQHSMRRTWRG